VGPSPGCHTLPPLARRPQLCPLPPRFRGRQRSVPQLPGISTSPAKIPSSPPSFKPLQVLDLVLGFCAHPFSFGYHDFPGVCPCHLSLIASVIPVVAHRELPCSAPKTTWPTSGPFRPHRRPSIRSPYLDFFLLVARLQLHTKALPRCLGSQSHPRRLLPGGSRRIHDDRLHFRQIRRTTALFAARTKSRNRLNERGIRTRRRMC
jgi:hypothetical protein